jgi:hypothetical protein
MLCSVMRCVSHMRVYSVIIAVSDSTLQVCHRSCCCANVVCVYHYQTTQPPSDTHCAILDGLCGIAFSIDMFKKPSDNRVTYTHSTIHYHYYNVHYCA